MHPAIEDNLASYRRAHWPRACFPRDTPEEEIYRYVLWQFIDRRRAEWVRERAALRPPLAFRLVVRARWCGCALRTAWRLFRLTLILDGAWPNRLHRRALRGGVLGAMWGAIPAIAGGGFHNLIDDWVIVVCFALGVAFALDRERGRNT